MKNNVSVALGLCFGVALGTPIGAVLHHIGMGTVLGAALGLLTGAVISSQKQSID